MQDGGGSFQLETDYGGRNMLFPLEFRLSIHTQIAGKAAADFSSSALGP